MSERPRGLRSPRRPGTVAARATRAAITVSLTIVAGVAVGVTGMSPPAKAQPAEIDVEPGATLQLSLADAISIALARSPAARQRELAYLRARRGADAARGRQRLNASLALDAPSISSSVGSSEDSLGLPIYTTYGATDWRSMLELAQPLPTGGRLSLSASASDRTDTVFDDIIETTSKTRTSFNSVGIRLVQPLLVPNSRRLALERARLELERAERRYTQSELDLVHDVTDRFYALYRARRELELARGDARRKEASLATARAKFEAGLIPEVEALQLDVDHAQSQNTVLTREAEERRVADEFKSTIGVPNERDVVVRVELDVRPITVEETDAVARALANRPELRDLDTDVRLAELSAEESGADGRISAELQLSYGLRGISDGALDTGSSLWDRLDSSFEDLRRRPAEQGLVLRINVPLWDSGISDAERAIADAQLQSRLIDREDRIRTIAREARDAVTRVNESKRRIELLARSQAVAERAFEISSTRFENGDITAQDLADDRDRLTRAETDHLDAIISYQLALSDLRRRTLHDFERDRSLVAPPRTVER